MIETASIAAHIFNLIVFFLYAAQIIFYQSVPVLYRCDMHKEWDRVLLMLFKSHTLIHIVRAAFYPPMKLVWWQFHVKLASQTNYKNRMHRMNNIMVNLTTWYKHTNAWECAYVCVYVINTYTMGCCIGCVSQQRHYGHVHVRIHIRYFMRHCVRDHKCKRPSKSELANERACL